MEMVSIFWLMVQGNIIQFVLVETPAAPVRAAQVFLLEILQDIYGTNCEDALN